MLWLESAPSLDDAKSRLLQLAAHTPGEYLLLNHKTGTELVIKLEAMEAC